MCKIYFISISYLIWLLYKEWFFYINLFSLIIFYHSVWLGFELFGLRVQVFTQLVQLMLASKGYDNHHCHNKPPDRKWGWSVDDVMPRIDGPENLRILKRCSCLWTMQADKGIENWVLCHSFESWDWTIEDELEFLPLRHRVESWIWVDKDVVEFCRSLPIEMNWDLKHHERCRTLRMGLA